MMEIRLEWGSDGIRGCVSLLLKLLGWVFNCNFTRNKVEREGIQDKKAYDAAVRSSVWTPDSWKSFPVKHSPTWPDVAEFERALDTIRSSAPLVHPDAVLRLRKELAEVAQGQRFLLQGGDCAEQFSHATEDIIRQKVSSLMEMGQILGERIPCTKLARMAGQYAKPRSSFYEADGTLSFLGENVNGMDKCCRSPDPKRLIQGYECAKTTLKHAQNAMTDLNNNDGAAEDFFVSHEALLLPLEHATTKQVGKKFYNLGAHFVWIGDRTRQVDHAHLEYVRGIENPIGIKVGPSMTGEEIIKVLQLVWPNPEKSPGRVTLITRYGVDKIEKCLPEHIRAVQSIGAKPVWISDPCHGNTFATSNGYKTRDFAKIFEEIRLAAKIHFLMGSTFGGVHLEMTGEHVTECVGGPQNLTEDNLPEAYETLCDPRLNRQQSIAMAKLVKRLQ